MSTSDRLQVTGSSGTDAITLRLRAGDATTAEVDADDFVTADTGFARAQFRDDQLGRIHPGDTLLTHGLVGKLSLGINADEQPRWG